MCIVAHGIDVVDIERFSILIERGGKAFLDRCFVAKELDEASYNTNERLAAWFAVKEAVLKALGTGQTNGATFTDIEVAHNDIGAPRIVLSGRSHELAMELGISNWSVSISHIEKIAMASVIGTAA